MSGLGAVERLTAVVDPVGPRLELTASDLSPGRYELRIETEGLRETETGEAVNEPGIIYLPPREGPVSLEAKPAVPAGAENVFFFNDLVAGAEDWELVLQFAPNVTGSWKLNGDFSKIGGDLRPELTIPVVALARGENLLHFDARETGLPAMFFRRAIPAGSHFSTSLRVGHADWRGRIALIRRTEREHGAAVATIEVAGSPPSRETPSLSERWWERRDMMEERLLAVSRNVLRAQVEDSRSRFAGGFHLVYDPQRHSYRMPHWIWAWGPAIHFLLEMERSPVAQRAGETVRFRTAALAAARRSLDFGVDDPRHPAFGVSTVRWEPSRAARNGWVEYVSTADSLFLAGWGWMSAYRATREPAFLGRTQKLVSAAERLMEQFPVVPQDWVVERERWTPHTLDESVFGMIGFRELHAATGSPGVAESGRRFLESHLKHMGRASGLLERAWLRDEDRAIWEPDIKGHAWVVEGYLDAHRLSGDPRYLALARTLADRVLECQGADGAWTHLFKSPSDGDPRDDKGTAIWAYFLYDVHRATGDEKYLAAARRALGWCLRQQYRGDDPNLDGAIVHANGMAYIRPRPLVILYTNVFFGLALLEELAR